MMGTIFVKAAAAPGRRRWSVKTILCRLGYFLDLTTIIAEYKSVDSNGALLSKNFVEQGAGCDQRIKTTLCPVFTDTYSYSKNYVAQFWRYI